VLRLLANGEVPLLLVNVISLALWTALPALLLAYWRQSMAMRGMRPEFSLRPSEATELDRALLLYERVGRRLGDIDARRPLGLWRALFVGPADADCGSADDRENLQAYACHLRATIVRLRGLPLERLRAWVHIASTRFALGNAVLVHVETFVLLVAAFYFSRQLPWAVPWAVPWAQKLTPDMAASLVWYPFDARIFHANAAAAIIAALLSPLFYLLRRGNLRDAYGLEFHVLTDLAEAGPDQKIRQPQPDFADSDLADSNLADSDLADNISADIDLADNDGLAAGTSTGMDRNEPWFAVLGVARSASMEQVTEAYKVLIKQSHPDRVQGMSPAIRNVAEAEAKRLNVAYEQAQASLT
jgi:DnaJ-domain-containing protein 1